MSVFDQLREIVPSKVLQDAGVPSISMALRDDTGISTAHVNTKGNEDTDTMYQACSISKAITALAIAKLVDLGVISYDGKVVDHVRSDQLEKLGLTATHLSTVTIGSLVSHTSGLSQHGFPGYTQQPLPSIEDIFNGRLPSNTPRIYFKSFPFAQLSYSGGGFLLLQLCLEYVLRKPFGQIMQEVVLDPLQMSRSSFDILPEDERNYAKAFLTADQVATTTSCGYHIFRELAAAGLWTTPTDLLKAVAAIQDSLRNENGFISRTVARQMLTKVTPNQDILSMAMGWGADDRFFAHRGDNDPGYTSYVFGAHGGVVNSSEDSTFSHCNGAFAIMVNSVLGHDMIKKIVAAVFYLMKWPAVSSLPSRFGSGTDFIPLPLPGKPIDGSWRAWTGKWEGGWGLVDEDAPKVLFQSLTTPVSLLPAAAPLARNAHHYLVVEDHDIAIRLVLIDGERKIQVIQGGVEQSLQRMERS